MKNIKSSWNSKAIGKNKLSCNTDPSWTICNKLSIPQYPEGQKSQQINMSLFIVFSVAHQKYRWELTLFLFYGKSVILFYFFNRKQHHSEEQPWRQSLRWLPSYHRQSADSVWTVAQAGAQSLEQFLPLLCSLCHNVRSPRDNLQMSPLSLRTQVRKKTAWP